MEKAKALIAVALFVATLLFSAYLDENDQKENRPKVAEKIVVE